MAELLGRTPADFARWLSSQGIRRAFVCLDEATLRPVASHPALAPLAELCATDTRDFDRHEGLFLQVAPETGVLQAAFVHRTCRGQAARGVRYWGYDTVEAFLRDGLRLSKGMAQKNALAGLWWGGGKGVMARGTGSDLATRRRIYEEYGAFVTSLRGLYVTAEDVGTNVDDMAAVFARTRFTTCIPPALGGSGNPSVPTARGVVRAIEGALAHLGQGELAGKVVAVHGLGNVGGPLVRFLAERGVRRVIGCDLEARRLDEVRAACPDLELSLHVAARGDSSILAAEADVVAPCAIGGVLGPETIPTIRARLVCGAANNQLLDPERDDLALGARGITYVPDFLANRMGIVTCADEGAGYDDGDSIERHLGTAWDNAIYPLTRRVLEEAARTGTTPHRVARALADRRAEELHPIFGHRGKGILRAIIASGWAG